MRTTCFFDSWGGEGGPSWTETPLAWAWTSPWTETPLEGTWDQDRDPSEGTLDQAARQEMTYRDTPLDRMTDTRL